MCILSSELLPSNRYAILTVRAADPAGIVDTPYRAHLLKHPCLASYPVWQPMTCFFLEVTLRVNRLRGLRVGIKILARPYFPSSIPCPAEAEVGEVEAED